MDNKYILGQKDLENEITELEETLKIKKEQLDKLRLVNENGKYVLTSTGEVLELNLEIPQDTWEKAIKQGNTFKTVKDAEKERDRRELLYEFNQFKNERNNGWAPNWGDCYEAKHCITFGSSKLLTTKDVYVIEKFSTFGYFKDYRACFDAINKFGDRIKKLYID